MISMHFMIAQNDCVNRCCRQSTCLVGNRGRQLRLHGYAQHGRELVGCKSPVRKRDSRRRQYAKCFLLSEVQGEGNCGRAIDRGKEACEM